MYRCQQPFPWKKGVYEVQATLTNQDGTASDLNAGLKSARLYTDKDGNVTAYLYVDGITGMQYRKGAGYGMQIQTQADL